MSRHRPAERTSRGCAPGRLTSFSLAMAVLCTPAPLAGQEWLQVQGILDAEGWVTDSNSVFLTRNDGQPSPLGRLRLWSVLELHPTVHIYGLGVLESGGARRDGGTDVVAEQAGIRFSPTPALVLDVGRIPSPVGTFPNRRFSTRNPLIGAPDGYPVSYPLAVQASGAVSRFDYRVALTSRPVSNERYVPAPTAAPRLALGAGVTLITGFRLGTSFTRGPYVNDELSTSLLAGTDWTDHQQQIVAFDARFSRGYLEFQGEMAFSEYDVPTLADPVKGETYYLEVKYTWFPRLFTAVRFETNNYPFIRPRGTDEWTARAVNFYNAEVGIGYRLARRTVIKASHRRDFWDPEGSAQAFLRDGFSFAMQISHQFDVKSWLGR